MKQVSDIDPVFAEKLTKELENGIQMNGINGEETLED